LNPPIVKLFSAAKIHFADETFIGAGYLRRRNGSNDAVEAGQRDRKTIDNELCRSMSSSSNIRTVQEQVSKSGEVGPASQSLLWTPKVGLTLDSHDLWTDF
jgi:hypothetical protein